MTSPRCPICSAGVKAVVVKHPPGRDKVKPGDWHCSPCDVYFAEDEVVN